MVKIDKKYPPAKRGKIVVWGLLSASPSGGMVWQVLHHVVGFRRLGFDVWYVEDSERRILDPDTWIPTENLSKTVDFIETHMEMAGFGNRWIYRSSGVCDRCFGAADLKGLKNLYRDTDFVFNLCGAQELRPEHDSIKCLVYLETDPVALQIFIAGKNRKVAKLVIYRFECIITKDTAVIVILCSKKSTLI